MGWNLVANQDERDCDEKAEEHRDKPHDTGYRNCRNGVRRVPEFAPERDSLDGIATEPAGEQVVEKVT